MKEKTTYPMVYELIRQAFYPTETMYNRAYQAILRAALLEHNKYEKDILEFIYSASEKKLSSINNLGIKSAKTLFSFTHSVKGLAYAEACNLDIEKPADISGSDVLCRLIDDQINEYNEKISFLISVKESILLSSIQAD